MSAHITIALTIAIVVLVNAHIAVARSAPMLPSEYLMDKEADQLSNRMTYDDYQHPRYVEDFPEEQQSPLAVNVLHRFGKHERIEEPIHNMLDEQLKSAEEYPEPLPTPLALNPMKISPFKKSGSEYHMTICHFKICNMGRKRDTSHQKF